MAELGYSRGEDRLMEFVFDEERAAQAAAYLLRRHGGAMPSMKLVHLLYLVDRRGLIEAGYPATGDRFVATPHGPALSRILDLLTWGCRNEDSPWQRYVSTPANYCVEAIGPRNEERLSEYDHEVLDAVLSDFGAMDQWALADHMQALPEWVDPGCGAAEVDPRVILQSAGYSDDEIEHVEEEVAAVHWLRTNFAAAG